MIEHWSDLQLPSAPSVVPTLPSATTNFAAPETPGLNAATTQSTESSTVGCRASRGRWFRWSRELSKGRGAMTYGYEAGAGSMRLITTSKYTASMIGMLEARLAQNCPLLQSPRMSSIAAFPGSTKSAKLQPRRRRQPTQECSRRW